MGGGGPPESPGIASSPRTEPPLDWQLLVSSTAGSQAGRSIQSVTRTLRKASLLCHPSYHSPQESKHGASPDLSPSKAGPSSPSLDPGPCDMLTASPSMQTEVAGILPPTFISWHACLFVCAHLCRKESTSPDIPAPPPVAPPAGAQEHLPLLAGCVLVTQVVFLQSGGHPMMPVVTVQGTGKQTGIRGDDETGGWGCPSESQSFGSNSGRGWAVASALGVNPEVIPALSSRWYFPKSSRTGRPSQSQKPQPQRLEGSHAHGTETQGRKHLQTKEVNPGIKIHSESKCSGTGKVPETRVNRGHGSQKRGGWHGK